MEIIAGFSRALQGLGADATHLYLRDNSHLRQTPSLNVFLSIRALYCVLSLAARSTALLRSGFAVWVASGLLFFLACLDVTVAVPKDRESCWDSKSLLVPPFHDYV